MKNGRLLMLGESRPFSPIDASPSAVGRLGQEPPPKPVEEVFDGRSLAEVCHIWLILVLKC